MHISQFIRARQSCELGRAISPNLTDLYRYPACHLQNSQLKTPRCLRTSSFSQERKVCLRLAGIT